MLLNDLHTDIMDDEEDEEQNTGNEASTPESHDDSGSVSPQAHTSHPFSDTSPPPEKNNDNADTIKK
jgi:hypothetical protein